MKRRLYLIALALSILTAISYTIGKSWEEKAREEKHELSVAEKLKGWRILARQGDPEAQYQLGIYYETEWIDYLSAQKWFRVAATKGQHSGAQYKLAQLYMNGQGVENNLPEAMRLFRLSAAQGDERAQYFLGIAARDGWERKPDMIEAYKWFLLANRDGDKVRAEDSRYDPQLALDEMDAVVSKFDRERARMRAEHWHP